MSVSKTTVINKIDVTGDLHVEADGSFTVPKGSFSEHRGTLTVNGSDTGSDTVFNFGNINQGNIITSGNMRIGGGNYFNSISCSNNMMTFNAPASTMLCINGRQITVGEIERLASGQSTGESIKSKVQATTEKYQLHPNSRITHMEIKGNGKVYIPIEFLSLESLSIEMMGNSQLMLPKSATFTKLLTAVCSGNTKIQCADNAFFVTCCTIVTSGNARVSGLTVHRNSTISASGNSRVSVTAYDRDRITKTTSGNAAIDVDAVTKILPPTLQLPLTQFPLTLQNRVQIEKEKREQLDNSEDDNSDNTTDGDNTQQSKKIKITE